MRIGRVFAALLVSTLALAGCTEDPKPIIAEPSAAPTPTASASPTPTESATPKAETPEEFIRRWNDIKTEMFATGQAREFRALGTRRCEPCNALADAIESYYDAGGFVRSEGWTIRSVRPMAPGTMNVPTYLVETTSGPTKYKKSESAPIETLPGGQNVYTFEFKQRQSLWLVDNYLVNAG